MSSWMKKFGAKKRKMGNKEREEEEEQKKREDTKPPGGGPNNESGRRHPEGQWSPTTRSWSRRRLINIHKKKWPIQTRAGHRNIEVGQDWPRSDRGWVNGGNQNDIQICWLLCIVSQRSHHYPRSQTLHQHTTGCHIPKENPPPETPYRQLAHIPQQCHQWTNCSWYHQNNTPRGHQVLFPNHTSPEDPQQTGPLPEWTKTQGEWRVHHTQNDPSTWHRDQKHSNPSHTIHTTQPDTQFTGLKFALDKFDNIIWGSPVKIETDFQALRDVLLSNNLNAMHTCWRNSILAHQIVNVQHILGRIDLIRDDLSCKDKVNSCRKGDGSSWTVPPDWENTWDLEYDLFIADMAPNTLHSWLHIRFKDKQVFVETMDTLLGVTGTTSKQNCKKAAHQVEGYFIKDEIL